MDEQAGYLSDDLHNSMSTKGYAVIDWLTDLEVLEVESIFSNEHSSFNESDSRDTLKWNSSLFELDIELKRRYNNKIIEFFQPKVDSILEGYDILMSNYWEKEPDDGEVMVHQNWTHVDESKFRSYSIWIPLQDTDETNGTMEIVPESQYMFSKLRGLNMEHPCELPFTSISDQIKDEYLQPINLRAGQAIVFDDAIVHYTGPNRSSHPRKAIQMVIKPKKAQGLFYFKHRDSREVNNVEVFNADTEFYIQLKMITGGPTPTPHGDSREFVTHVAQNMTMDEFRAAMNRKT